MGLDWLGGPGLSCSFTVLFSPLKGMPMKPWGCVMQIKLFVLSLSEVTHIGKV